MSSWWWERPVFVLGPDLVASIQSWLFPVWSFWTGAADVTTVPVFNEVHLGFFFLSIMLFAMVFEIRRALMHGVHIVDFGTSTFYMLVCFVLSFFGFMTFVFFFILFALDFLLSAILITFDGFAIEEGEDEIEEEIEDEIGEDEAESVSWEEAVLEKTLEIAQSGLRKNFAPMMVGEMIPGTRKKIVDLAQAQELVDALFEKAREKAEQQVEDEFEDTVENGDDESGK